MSNMFSMSNKCPACTNPLGKRKQRVSCAGCSTVYHAMCSDMTESECSDTVEDWRCLNCRGTSTGPYALLDDADPLRVSPRALEFIRLNTPMEADIATANANFLANTVLFRQRLHNAVRNRITSMEEIVRESSSILRLSIRQIKETEARFLEMQTGFHTTLELFREARSLSQQQKLKIRGITQRNGENLLQVVESIGNKIGIDVGENISKIMRIPPSPASPCDIVALFTTENAKTQFLAAFRRKKDLYTNEIGLDEIKKIFVFEYLNDSQLELYDQCKVFQRVNNFKYLWTKNGNIYLRKGDHSEAVHVLSNDMLNELAQQTNNQE